MNSPPAPDHQALLASFRGLSQGAPEPMEAPEAAVAACFAPDENGAPCLLLIKRAEHPLDPWSGHIGLPGGRRDPADSTVLATACRETREEVGLSLGPTHFVGACPPIEAIRGGVATGLLVHPLVFALDAASPLVTNHEVAAARWVPLATLVDPAYGIRHEIATPAGPRRLPGVRLPADEGPEWLLWGLTYRMLSDLLSRSGLVLASGPPAR
ncbi:MAG: coenzyme A pyrophosphatase [Planctomycetes bacterium]|nr:coenzyme A pyrophosphatase [Planctomycetota bacterium]